VNIAEKTGETCPTINLTHDNSALLPNAELGLVPTHVQYVLAELVKNSIQVLLLVFLFFLRLGGRHNARPTRALLPPLPNPPRCALAWPVSSRQASIDRNRENPPPVSLHVTQAMEATTFTVQDEAGGVPNELRERMWSHAYTSTGLQPSQAHFVTFTT